LRPEVLDLVEADEPSMPETDLFPALEKLGERSACGSRDSVYTLYMSQINLHAKPEFERDLARFMRLRGLRTKSEAIRLAVREGLERAQAAPARKSFTAWAGAGLAAAPNPEPRFRSDDDLWRGSSGS
jgi:hypothetical protein